MRSGRRLQAAGRKTQDSRLTGSVLSLGSPVSGLRSQVSGLDVSADLLKHVARSHNLTEDDYARIVRVLGRQPTLTEVGIFGVMYSEHCSYASSKPYLKTFPTRGKSVLVPAGKENAGVVDIGDGLAIAFKCESHNHPSAVEPVQGAATGVGGIIRDIFTMGARPIALLDSLRFGSLASARTKFLFEGVVKGISDYGNAVGVPTVGGEIYFDSAYQENPLVNVMCIGLLEQRQLAHAAASGLGNPVIYVGSSTGRDGLGGASFASRELIDGDADRPAVQIGDPFTEKCLIEATLEALATGDVVGIQDMGAAGLTCSTCEMPARGGSGIEIDVAKVPRREEGMTPYEIMLSESQERMLLILKRGRQAKIASLFAKWGLNAVEIGRVTRDGRMRVNDHGVVVADIPVSALTDEAPIYHRPTKRPAYLAKTQQLSLRSLPVPKDLTATLTTLLASPTIANKRCVYEQYDHMVQTNTTVLPGRADAAVLRVKGTTKWLAATIDGNGRYCYLDPYEGGKLAVAEAARNLVCVGARPLAITDCLNFGNPNDPEIMWQFKECVRGIADACRAFETPVTGGNVSFYNEGPSGAIDPTPVIGMIGVMEPRPNEAGSWKLEAGKRRFQSPASSFQYPITANFKEEGDTILLLGETKEELGGSEYLSVIHHRKAGKPPRVDLQQELALQRLMIDAAAHGWLKSAHDCSEGGLAVTLAESCIMDEDHLIGARIEVAQSTKQKAHRVDAILFGESAGRIVISCARGAVEPLVALAKRHGVAAAAIGNVGGSRLMIGSWVDVLVEDLSAAWRTGLATAVNRRNA
ncbi:MAG: phosphoribosylformylglycinamidine synthase subunit PurL [Candidatus Omnitrophica bacterium]|nr:phosphoribosylformylglycinamidine synthase subunit PurL [Candidatus Omnitrophota bacterium]